MNALRKRRLTVLIVIVLGLMAVVFLVLFALRQNINLYYTPSELASGKVPIGQNFRIGGLVKKNSVSHRQGLSVDFILTDTVREIAVHFNGILPDLFREGQGIVALGKLDGSGRMIASQVLAKHDSNYMPPAVTDAIAKAKGGQNDT